MDSRIEKISLDTLNELGNKWLQAKIQRIKNLLKIAEPDEALYREIMLSLGYPKNKVQFLELALILPFKELKELKDRNIIEKALLYRAGFIDCKDGLPKTFDFSLRMNKSVWDFKRIRPANYPDKRIRGVSHLLAESVCDGLVNNFLMKLKSQITQIYTSKDAENSVKKIMDFKGIGRQRKKDIFFNIIMPFTIACSGDDDQGISKFLSQIFELHPPLFENSVIKSFKKLLPQGTDYSKLNCSTRTYFGIIFYMKEI